MTIEELGQKITEELRKVLAQIKEEEIERFIEEILKARRIFLYGLGRALLMTKAFAMRLVHLGFNAHVIGDVTIPNVKQKDLLIICSGSGETDTTFLLATKAKKMGGEIVCATAHPHSRIGKLSNITISIPAQTKVEGKGEISSIQPMATLYEQSLLLFLDLIVILLMERMGETSESMWERHFNLE